jgi:glycosyltransferase involved in cell wall biosynthesis
MRNAERYVAQCLRSILRETSTAIEVIVVNDKSTDRSLEEVLAFDDPRLRVIGGPLRGISACLNVALEGVKGEIVMRCDADDIYPEGRIREQARWLENNPEFGALCGAFSTIDAAGKLVARMPCGFSSNDITEELRRGETRTHLCTFAIRSSVIERVGNFREFFASGEDIDFQLRLAENCDVMYLPNNFYSYRIHASSITHRQKTAERLFYKRMAREFQIQRKHSGSDALERGLLPSLPISNANTALSANEHIQGLLLGSAWSLHRSGKKLAALKSGVRALWHGPTSLKAWKSIFTLAIKYPRSPPDDGN